MKTLISAVAILLLCSFTLLSADSKNKKSKLPSTLVVARYVMVTSYYGNAVADPNTPSDDRQAIADVEDAIQKWGKYSLVYRPEQADIIILVRKGRTATVTPRIHTGTGVGIDPKRRSGDVRVGSGTDNRTGVGIGAEAGSPDDMIAIYDGLHGTDSSPLWQATMRNGLVPPEMKLVKQFRQALDEAVTKP